MPVQQYIAICVVEVQEILSPYKLHGNKWIIMKINYNVEDSCSPSRYSPWVPVDLCSCLLTISRKTSKTRDQKQHAYKIYFFLLIESCRVVRCLFVFFFNTYFFILFVDWTNYNAVTETNKSNTLYISYQCLCSKMNTLWSQRHCKKRRSNESHSRDLWKKWKT